MFSKRCLQPELLDHLPPENARPNLADLVTINTRLGGHSTLTRTVQGLFPTEKPFSVLDIGAASGDTALTIKRNYPAASVVSLDYNETNMEKAPPPKVRADAFALPFRTGAFDFVMCSLFTHHFTDEQVTALIRAFYGIARHGVIVIDLERHILPYIAFPVLSWLFRLHRVSVHDGLISIRAAFNARELDALARAAGIGNVNVQVFRPAFRLAMTCEKNHG